MLEKIEKIPKKFLGMKFNFYLPILLVLVLNLAKIKANQNNQIVLVNENPVEEEENNNDAGNKRKSSFDIKFDETGGLDTFVPTNEWQAIKPGQAIPKGIHVRLNMQTGEREGKLLDNADATGATKKESLVGGKRTINKELEDSIKSLNDDFKAKNGPPEPSNEDDQITRGKFKTYEEIKSEMKEMNLNVKTDYELIRELIRRLNETDKLERTEKLAILKDLEYYVHQYDNGLLLCDMGGFNIILSDLNKTISEDVQVNIASILVLGSAIQSNPKVKVFALKTDLLQYILNKLSTQSTTDSSALIIEFNSKLVFALSGLLRNFPFAQSQFIRYGGVEILSHLIQNSNSIKLKTKILTLIDDLINEKKELLANANLAKEDPNDYAEKLEQYKNVNLIEELMRKNWCKNFELLLSKAEDHDTREKIINSIKTLVNECSDSFCINRNMKSNLKKLEKEYVNLKETDEDGAYFTELITSIYNVLDKINKINCDLF